MNIYDYWDYHEMLARIWWGTFGVFLLGSSVLLLPGGPSLPGSTVDSIVESLVGSLPFGNILAGMALLLFGGWFVWGAYAGRERFTSFTYSRRWRGD